MKATMEELAQYMLGWRGYFGFCETPDVLIALTRWVRLRLRAAFWRQWKKHIGVGERHSSRWESRGSCSTRPEAAVAPGILPGVKRSPWDFPMLTSNRSVSRPWSKRVSLTKPAKPPPMAGRKQEVRHLRE